jgi:prepilin-type N-terminal cleavage/methylation domain-containing protein
MNVLHHTQANRSRRSGGYTLMELLIVLALIALAATLVVPITLHSYASLKLRVAANSVTALFQQARSQARYHSQVEQVVFTPAQDRQTKLFLIGEDGKQAGRIILPSGIFLSLRRGTGEWTDRPEPLHFFPNGTSESMQLDLHDAMSRHIQIELIPFTAKARVSAVIQGD